MHPREIWCSYSSTARPSYKSPRGQLASFVSTKETARVLNVFYLKAYESVGPLLSPAMYIVIVFHNRRVCGRRGKIKVVLSQGAE